ncbi:MAG: radical SAM protein, partial [Bacilli bacterium]
MIEKCYVIPIQSQCNNNCLFCISKSREYNKECSILEINNQFIDNLYLLKKRKITKFEITGGGEPLLHKHLDVIVNTIKKIIPDAYIKIYTNGNILKNLGNIDELDISVVHYNLTINNYFMGSNCLIDIEDKLKYYKNIYPFIKIRLSIPIIKGAIDTPEKLQTFINKTNAYVDEYVVRSLYPNTPNYNDLYSDFIFDNEKVVLEKDNDVSFFNGLILWSDNKLYQNWQLNNLRYLYSYLLLKPDSRTYINEIEKTIYQNDFEIKEIYQISDFISYASHFYKDKSSEYFEVVKRHLINTAYLFGNQGLIFILDKDCSYEQLVEETNKLKQLIRNEFSFTHSQE